MSNKIDFLRLCCVNPAGTFTFFDGGSQEIRLISPNSRFDWKIYYDNELMQNKKENFNKFVWKEEQEPLTKDEIEAVKVLVEMEIDALTSFLKILNKE